jgi:hypothetical protein
MFCLVIGRTTAGGSTSQWHWQRSWLWNHQKCCCCCCHCCWQSIQWFAARIEWLICEIARLLGCALAICGLRINSSNVSGGNESSTLWNAHSSIECSAAGTHTAAEIRMQQRSNQLLQNLEHKRKRSLVGNCRVDQLIQNCSLCIEKADQRCFGEEVIRSILLQQAHKVLLNNHTNSVGGASTNEFQSINQSINQSLLKNILQLPLLVVWEW